MGWWWFLKDKLSTWFSSCAICWFTRYWCHWLWLYLWAGAIFFIYWSSMRDYGCFLVFGFMEMLENTHTWLVGYYYISTVKLICHNDYECEFMWVGLVLDCLVLICYWKLWIFDPHMKSFDFWYLVYWFLNGYKGSFLFLNWLRRKVFITYLMMKWSFTGLCFIIPFQCGVTCSCVQVTTNWQTLEGVTLLCSVFIVKRLRSPYTLSIRSKSILVQDIRHKFGWFYFSIKLVILSFLQQWSLHTAYILYMVNIWVSGEAYCLND